MTTDDFELKLTAYALNDPSLTDAERGEIEDRLRTDPAARQLLDDTRAVSHLLTTSLAAEAQPATPSVAPAVAATLAKPKATRRWVATIASLAAVLMVAVFAYKQFDTTRQHREREVAFAKPALNDTAADGRVDLKNTDKGLDSELANALPVERMDEQTVDAKVQPNSTIVSGLKAQSARPNVGGGGFQGGGGMPGTGGLPGGGGRGGIGGSGFAGGGPVPPSGYIAPPPPPVSLTPAKPVPDSILLSAPATPGLVPTDGTTREKSREAEGDVKALNDADFEKSPRELDGLFKSRTSSVNSYRELIENPFTRVEGMNALSTFGVDVDTASYSIVRNYLNHNTIPHPDAVRLEEMINYFPYRDAPPEGNDPFTVRVEMADCPWASKHRLARIALKAKPIDNSKRPTSNLVFLIDVSGSMNEPNKLPLVKASMKLLVEQLGENDRVAMVVYAGASGLVLESTNASKKETILKALDNLSAGGSTNGGAGIQLAYDVAVKNFIEKGTNRVILCTDGDYNVGTTSTDALIKLIEEKRKTGVFLSVFGFGMGNLRDEMMVQLAGKGNGNYGYIDSIAEAKKALVEQISGTLVTVAKDVKIQIEFNPAKIASYRLIGYEKRKLAAQDFHNDKKDAGEMGAGHVVTALYELIPVGAAAAEAPKVDGLRYQPAPVVEKPKAELNGKTSNEAFVVKLRHKLPDADKSTLREIPVGDVTKSYDKASEDFQFASSVAAFGMLLKQSPYKGQATFALVEELAMSSMTHDPGAYRAEFLQLVRKAKSLTGGK